MSTRSSGSRGSRDFDSATPRCSCSCSPRKTWNSRSRRQFNYPILACGQNGVGEEVIAGYKPESPMVEPLRALRSQILFRWPRDTTRKVIAVTSAERGDGRSWLAANLATVFAQIGERTLLIDADMRHPRQHLLFNLNNEVGLSALVTGRATREIARRIHPQLRLFVLPSGRLPPNPQELLSGPVFDVVLEQFTEQFDVIVIDTPAMAETADAQILAARAGNALMVARQESHAPEEDRDRHAQSRGSRGQCARQRHPGTLSRAPP